MNRALQETFEQDCDTLRHGLGGQLRVVAEQSVKVWFNRERLDKLLSGYVNVLPGCELLFAIDFDGRQVSSNIHSNRINTHAYGQDLSQRPYAVSLSALNSAAFRGAIASKAYTSHVSQHSCVTVMYGVRSGASQLGYIAADIQPSGG